MKIMLISYENFEYDGRLRELYSVFNALGTVYLITNGETAVSNTHYLISKTGYGVFLKEVLKYKRQIGNVDVLVLDNRKATIPGLIIKMFSNTVVVQDCRELYESKNIHHIIGKIGCFFEKKSINQADVIICANEQRAQMMRSMYNLRKSPLVFENLRKLEYSEGVLLEELEKKFEEYIHADEFRIISTSGCDFSRLNDILVRNLTKVKKNVRLILIGDKQSDDYRNILKIIHDNQLDNNVSILGRLNQSELKYLINRSHIGIVSYNQRDLNNKFCASGKIYEFIYEGIPVVTTTNEPLKKLCDTEKIGVADDNFYNGINSVLDNYQFYKNNAIQFGKEHPVKENNDKLQNSMKSIFEHNVI